MARTLCTHRRFSISLTSPCVSAAQLISLRRHLIAWRDPSSQVWIHVDADVLDPSVLPAVDSPEPDGLLLDELAELLSPLARHEKALGLEVTIYDPKLDPDRASAARLATLLERALGGD